MTSIAMAIEHWRTYFWQAFAVRLCLAVDSSPEIRNTRAVLGADKEQLHTVVGQRVHQVLIGPFELSIHKLRVGMRRNNDDTAPSRECLQGQ